MSTKKTGPNAGIESKSGSEDFKKRLAGLVRLAAYVGVPAKNSRRKPGKSGSEEPLNNAELLYIHTKGSPLHNIPARAVLQPAISAPDNKEKIAREIANSVKSNIAGDKEKAKQGMLRAALVGQNAARAWFRDPRNGWPPNTPATIKAKGSDQPLIDTGALRNAIVGVVREE